MEEKHEEIWSKHLEYLQNEANGKKGQSVNTKSLFIHINRCFFI